MYDESRFDTIAKNGDVVDKFQMVPDVENGRAGEPIEYIHKDVDRGIIKRKKRSKPRPLEAKQDWVGHTIFQTSRTHV